LIIRGNRVLWAFMHTIKYRMTEERLRPRRTKLQIPGWPGEPEPRADGSHEYAWHCVPFSEAAQYGLEVFYPYDNVVHVSTIAIMMMVMVPILRPSHVWVPFGLRLSPRCVRRLSGLQQGDRIRDRLDQLRIRPGAQGLQSIPSLEASGAAADWGLGGRFERPDRRYP
jgi:hypothetical protein